MTIRRRVHAALALMMIVPFSFMALSVATLRHLAREGAISREGPPADAGRRRPPPPPDWAGGYPDGVPWSMLFLLALFVVTGGGLAWWVSRAVVPPLARLRAAALRIGEGDLDFALRADPVARRVDEVAETIDAFETMRLKLKDALASREASERARAELVAHVSHDLRTPLAVIRGYAEGLRDGIPATEADRARYASVILDRAAELDGMIELLFDYARNDLEAGSASLEPVATEEFLRACRETALGAWPGIEVELDAASDAVALMDRAKAARVVANVAENAARYARRGERPPRMRWKARREGDRVTISLSDDGEGVSPENLPRLFEPFFRCDRSRPRGGSGLGLAIVRRLMEAQGGQASARAADSGGLEIVLAFREAR